MKRVCYAENPMKILASTALIISLSLGTTAQAYILPPKFILKILAEKQAKAKTSDWSLTLSTQKLKDNITIEERLYIKRPERLRRVQTTTPARIHIEIEGKTAPQTPTSLSVAERLSTAFIGSLMVTQGSSTTSRVGRMLNQLQAGGIDTEIVSLGRRRNRPVYIIGAKGLETNKPQIGFDKESFLPVYWILYSQRGQEGDKIEVDLIDYNGSPAGNIYPRLIETRQNGELVVRSLLLQAKSNQALPESLFSLH